MPKYHKSKIVNLMKIVYIPMILSIALILIMNILSIYIYRKNLISQYREEGILIANQIGSQLSRNIEAQKYAESILEDKIKVAALTVLEMKKTNTLSNEWLHEMLTVLAVSELHYMDPDGKILFSTIEGYLGWEPHPDHPLYEFVKSTDKELMEHIRPDDRYKIPIKYGAVKSETQSFVQVGLDAEIVEYAKDQFSYQSIVDDILENPNVMGARFMDTNLKSLAYSGGFDLSPVMKADLEYFNAPGDVWIERGEGYEFYIPIFYKAQLFGILNIDYSLEAFNAFNRQLFWIHSALIMFLIIMILSFQYKMIIMPIYELETQIMRIDVKKNTFYKLPMKKNNAFFGTAKIINEILEDTYRFIFELYQIKEELISSNEELSAAYQQIQASEEILRDQYNEIIEQKQHIEHIAFHDELTGLFNRQGFAKWFAEKQPHTTQGAVLLIGIDNFKNINNTLGHEVGDKIIRSIAKIIKESSPNVTVSRFSGDEFIVFVNHYKEKADIDCLIGDIMNRLKNSVEVDFKKIYITASIGVSIYPSDSKDMSRLIMNADSAVFRVKESGKNGYLYFNEEMTAAITKKSEIEAYLRKAIDENLFDLVYQPQVSLQSGKIVGLEALLRIKNNPYGPDVFIPIAEESGIIIAMGRWVAKTTIEQLAAWRNQGLEMKTIAINFSPIQLRDTDFHEYLADLLLEHKVPSKYIEIEVTENILIENMDQALEYLNKFKDLNIKLALDDFGTGFSSLNYLSTLPISKVKLDKSIIWRYTNENKDDVIKNLVDLSKCFSLSLVAEGVEEVHMVAQLKKCGVDIVQGYFYSKPVEATSVYEVISEIEKNFFTVYFT